MSFSLKTLIIGREVTQDARHYLLKEFYKHAKVTVFPAIIACIVLMLFEWRQLNTLHTWLWPILMLALQALRFITSRLASKKERPGYNNLFFTMDYLSAVWWVAYLFVYGWQASTEYEYLFRAFVVFNIYAFYLEVMRFYLPALLINSTIICLGILIYLFNFTTFTGELMWSYAILDVFGFTTLLFFGRSSHLLACDTHDLITRNKKLIAKMDDLLDTDELTQQPNRRYFNAQLARFTELFKSNQEIFSLAVLDIDHFKKINDTYGHNIGDSVLTQLAGFVRAKIRNTDAFARYGGEEFVVLLPLTTTETAFNVLDKLRSQCADHEFKIGELKLRLTISIGVTGIKLQDSEMKIFKRADEALYKAKNDGRNRVVLCE
jgi:diguanylate cyclase (GGDEF)-like protein